MARLSFLGHVAALACLVTLSRAACSLNTPPCATINFFTLGKTPGCNGDFNCACSKAGTYDELSSALGNSCGSSDKENTLSHIVAFCECVGAPIQSPSAGISTSSLPPTETTNEVPQTISTVQQTTSSVSELTRSTPTPQTLSSVSESNQAATFSAAATSSPTQPPVSTMNGSGKYSTSDKIALGVGIGLGLPTLLVALITLWTKCLQG